MNNPKGTKDTFGESMRQKRFVIDNMHEVFSKYGYQEIMTPAFEHLEVLEKKGALGGDNIKDIYRFQDKGNRWLGLRFDMTTPIARAIGTNNIASPTKLSYVTNMWRYEKPGKGRRREFWQAGFEYIGTTHPISDAEILAVNHDALKSIGVKEFTFRINSRASMDAIMDQINVENTPEIYSLIDKKEKIPANVWNDKLKELTEKHEEVSALFNMNKDELLNKFEKEITPIYNILELANKLGVSEENLNLDLSIIRGLDYYTGFIYETQVKGHENIGSVSSGGRYDTLLGKLGAGRDIPATGTALGIDRILDTLPITKPTNKTYVILPMSENEFNYAIDVQKKLQTMEKEVFIWPQKGPVGKNLKKINNSGYTRCILIGENEVNSGNLTLKNLKTYEQTTKQISEL